MRKLIISLMCCIGLVGGASAADEFNTVVEGTIDTVHTSNNGGVEKTQVMSIVSYVEFGKANTYICMRDVKNVQGKCNVMYRFDRDEFNSFVNGMNLSKESIDRAIVEIASKAVEKAAREAVAKIK